MITGEPSSFPQVMPPHWADGFLIFCGKDGRCPLLLYLANSQNGKCHSCHFLVHSPCWNSLRITPLEVTVPALPSPSANGAKGLALRILKSTCFWKRCKTTLEKHKSKWCRTAVALGAGVWPPVWRTRGSQIHRSMSDVTSVAWRLEPYCLMSCASPLDQTVVFWCSLDMIFSVRSSEAVEQLNIQQFAIDWYPLVSRGDNNYCTERWSS